MTYEEAFEIVNKYAPLSLSDKFCEIDKAYDNSGKLIEVSGEIKGVLFCLDLNSESVKLALKKGCNLIIPHHPAIYNPLKKI